MNHDQLFKEVIQAFFEEFLRLFFPAEAAMLDFQQVTFLNQEVFTDFPDGDVRRTDTLAQVRTLAGEPELILIHTEIQAYREADGNITSFCGRAIGSKSFPLFSISRREQGESRLSGILREY